MPGRVSRLPYVLLALMTLATFGGPILIGLVLRGGARPDWPPDRAVEWWTLGLVSGCVALLMAACLGIGLSSLGMLRKPGPSAEDRYTD